MRCTTLDLLLLLQEQRLKKLLVIADYLLPIKRGNCKYYFCLFIYSKQIVEVKKVNLLLENMMFSLLFLSTFFLIAF